MTDCPIARELRKAAADKADAHNSSAPMGVDGMTQEDTLYWQAADAVDRLRAALDRIAFCGAGEDYRALREIARKALEAD